MRYHDDNVSGRHLRILDRVLVSIYAYCYLAFFQVGLERHVHHIITDDAIPFHPYILALIFTTVIVALEIPVARILKFDAAWEPCNYLPSMLLLGLCTSYNETHFFGHSLLVWILILLLSALALLICRRKAEMMRTRKYLRYRKLMVNLFLMVLLLLVPMLIGNTSAALR